jgi:hypothetical protein
LTGGPANARIDPSIDTIFIPWSEESQTFIEQPFWNLGIQNTLQHLAIDLRIWTHFVTLCNYGWDECLFRITKFKDLKDLTIVLHSFESNWRGNFLCGDQWRHSRGRLEFVDPEQKSGDRWDGGLEIIADRIHKHFLRELDLRTRGGDFNEGESRTDYRMPTILFKVPTRVGQPCCDYFERPLW